MKIKKIIISTFVVTGLIAIIAIRLTSNKESFDKELQMVSETSGAIPVIVDTVRFQPIRTGFSADGIFDAIQEVTLASEVEGKLVSLNVKEGEHVASGATMALIDTTLYAAQLELSRYNLTRAENDFQRNEKLVKTDGVTMQQYEAAKQALVDSRSALVAAKNNYNNAFIKAPFNGVVTKRYINKGAFVTPGASIFDISAIQQLKLVVKLTSTELARVRPGQQAIVFSELYPGLELKGTIYSINVKADASKRYTVEVVVTNTNNNPINPGTFGLANFNKDEEEKHLTVPVNALVGSIKDASVFVVKADSVIAQKISVLPLNGKNVIVNSGLTSGDVVVISGQINLVNGSKIKVF